MKNHISRLIIASYCVLPVIFAVLGTCLFNFNGNNLIIIVLLLFIIPAPVILLHDYNGLRSMLPLLIYCISLSLLLHNSLVSSSLWGYDVQNEYYFANNVIQNSVWNPAYDWNINSALSIVLLAPVVSAASGLSLIWVFKLVYPMLFAFLPVLLYCFTLKQSNHYVGFLSAMFLAGTFIFYTDMLALARQEITQVLFGSILLLVVLTDMNKLKRMLLACLLGFALVFSQYSFAFIMVMILGFGLGFYWLSRQFFRKKLVRVREFDRRLLISPLFFSLFIGLVVLWYVYLTSSPFFSLVSTGTLISKSLLDIFNPVTNQGFGSLTASVGLTSSVPMLHRITSFLLLLFLASATLGFYKTIIGKAYRFRTEYIMLSFGAVSICVFSFAVPFFAASVNIDRIYFISQILLAPFCIIGLTFLFGKLFSRIPIKPIKITAIALCIFLIFNCGLLYYAFGEITPSAVTISLDSNYDYARFNSREVAGQRWFLTNGGNEKVVFADAYRLTIWYTVENRAKPIIGSSINCVPADSYLYLGTYNVRNNQVLSILYYITGTPIQGYVSVPDDLTNFNVIFNNDGSEILQKCGN